jgi:DNA invertase Pin-like site-specific DNA recombinase
MDFSGLYDYDGFRETEREGSHARRLCARLDRRRIFADKVSTTKTRHHGLADAVSHLPEGDVLVIWKLDRLGRTVERLVDFVTDLRQREVQFRRLTDGIDTTTPAGRFFSHIVASLITSRISGTTSPPEGGPL